jgi:hypothetical protein
MLDQVFLCELIQHHGQPTVRALERRDQGPLGPVSKVCT